MGVAWEIETPCRRVGKTLRIILATSLSIRELGTREEMETDASLKTLKNLFLVSRKQFQWFYRILNGVIRLGLSVCGHEHNENSLYSHSSSLLWGWGTDWNRIQGFRHARQLVLCHWAPLTLLETVFYWVVLIAFLILMYILLLNYNKVRYIILFNKIIEIWQFKYKIIKERLILFLGKLKQK